MTAFTKLTPEQKELVRQRFSEMGKKGTHADKVRAGRKGFLKRIENLTKKLRVYAACRSCHHIQEFAPGMLEDAGLKPDEKEWTSYCDECEKDTDFVRVNGPTANPQKTEPEHLAAQRRHNETISNSKTTKTKI